MGGTAGRRPVTSSRLASGASSAEPRPGPSASLQPLPDSKPSDRNRLVRRSNISGELIALTSVIALTIEFDCTVSGIVGCMVWSLESVSMSDETLLCEVENRIATVTLNRPKVLHALNSQVFDELERVFLKLKDDASLRVILLTGAGEKAFAAGADINELAATNAVTGTEKARRGQGVFRLIETCGKPVIALVNGFALGG